MYKVCYYGELIIQYYVIKICQNVEKGLQTRESISMTNNIQLLSTQKRQTKLQQRICTGTIRFNSNLGQYKLHGSEPVCKFLQQKQTKAILIELKTMNWFTTKYEQLRKICNVQQSTVAAK